MFRHILIPTDGSIEGARAVRIAVDLARVCGATVLAMHATVPFRGGRMAAAMAMAEVAYDFDLIAQAEHCVDAVRRLASEAGVVCETRIAYSGHPAQAIVETQRECGCDLIVMGRRSGPHMLGTSLGANVVRVLRESSVPVMICP
ncbi:nucleotide-binding universal stress UspA family protein [Luteibacter rhizovicinus]|uniref:Nucleotide-binding universal stress UspA family protein n=1 Tax=Luteibacter rhizovicinus TaxID=242606 RepID=A0A4R3YHC8_9GAMM|nr:universal stress protein [Luteibacter rhizovicinus]TCV91461.1 nucleotide-binding universal stress UspA family protein [Luteibacter rhizovicinus]